MLVLLIAVLLGWWVMRRFFPQTVKRMEDKRLARGYASLWPTALLAFAASCLLSWVLVYIENPDTQDWTPVISNAVFVVGAFFFRRWNLQVFDNKLRAYRESIHRD